MASKLSAYQQGEHLNNKIMEFLIAYRDRQGATFDSYGKYFVYMCKFFSALKKNTNYDEGKFRAYMSVWARFLLAHSYPLVPLKPFDPIPREYLNEEVLARRFYVTFVLTGADCQRLAGNDMLLNFEYKRVPYRTKWGTTEVTNKCVLQTLQNPHASARSCGDGMFGPAWDDERAYRSDAPDLMRDFGRVELEGVRHLFDKVMFSAPSAGGRRRIQKKHRK